MKRRCAEFYFLLFYINKLLAKVIVTEDSIIVEAFPESSLSSSFKNQRLLPLEPTWNEALAEGSSCLTSSGYLGSCTSFRHCYPYFKLPNLGLWESWILGNYDTCSYFTYNGSQAFGVCCISPITDLLSNANDINDKVGLNKSSIPAAWPPPIPTHPPNHAAPTHPSISSSAESTTAKKPITAWPSKPKPQEPSTSTVVSIWPPPIPTHPPPNVPSQRPIILTTIKQPIPTATPTNMPNFDGALNSICGNKNGFQDQERIVGGINADPNEWPWIAALFNGGRQFCGGSLIDKEHILTAAHCVAHMSSWDVARLTVQLGDHNIRLTTEVKHIERKIKRVVRHRGFDSRTLYNDVAVLTLDTPVTFTKAVQPICLPHTEKKVSHGQTGTVIGWGSLRENGPQPAVLQKVAIPIWSNNECHKKYGSAAPGGIVESMICAGQAAKDSCSGDSGGPLMINDKKWEQIGIVSWGIGCGKGQYPGVYSRVTYFLPWIRKNLVL